MHDVLVAYPQRTKTHDSSHKNSFVDKGEGCEYFTLDPSTVTYSQLFHLPQLMIAHKPLNTFQDELY